MENKAKTYFSGRRPIQNILKEMSGLLPYWGRNVSNNSPITPCRLIINNKILNITKKCVVEARSKLNNKF